MLFSRVVCLTAKHTELNGLSSLDVRVHAKIRVYTAYLEMQFGDRFLTVWGNDWQTCVFKGDEVEDDSSLLPLVSYCKTPACKTGRETVIDNISHTHTHTVCFVPTLRQECTELLSYFSFFNERLFFMTFLCMSILLDQHALLQPAAASCGRAHQGWAKPRWQVHLQGGPLWQSRFVVRDFLIASDSVTVLTLYYTER